MKDFRSDNILGAPPEILDAIARASGGSMTSYGGDEITERRIIELSYAHVQEPQEELT